MQTMKLSTFVFTIEKLSVDVIVRIEKHEDPFLNVSVDKISFRRVT
jgi:hypothetical protein